MASTQVADRAAQFVAEGRVREVIDLGGGRVRAKVGGYIVTRTSAGRLRCTCAAGSYGAECSHALAVALVLESS